jgi:hypothetical protein
MRNLVSGALLCVLLSGTSALAGVNMQEGSWETTVQMTMEGLPFPMPPTTYTSTQCLTKKDMVPSTEGKGQKCRIRNQKVSGNTVTWSVVCEDSQGRSEGEGKITYAGSSFSGVIKTKITTKGESKPMRSTMEMKGKRLGNCTK